MTTYEPPPPEPPTENGALIIASGVSGGDTFENKALVHWTPGLWYGDVRDGFLVDGRKYNEGADQITSWTEAVAVPKDKLDALRNEVEHARKAELTTMRTTDLGVHVRDAAVALIDAVDGAA